MSESERCPQIVSDGAIYAGGREPPGQASLYIPPGDIRKEQYRLATFRHFPRDSPVINSDLASSGFYYVGYKDRTKCFSCGIAVEDWSVGDRPGDKRWHKTDCDFANLRDTQNIPMEKSTGILTRILVRHGQSAGVHVPTQSIAPGSREGPTTPGVNQTGEHRRVTANNGSTEEYPSLQHPVSPNMRSLAARIESFRTRNEIRWPSERVRATVQEIANAGFFFLGENDRVKCWYCNGGLQNWNYYDDPWNEHAKWFPSCQFVQHIKGVNFVRDVTSRFPDIVRPVPVRQSEQSQLFSRNATTNSLGSSSSLTSAVNNAMQQLSYVTKAKDMGVTEEFILQVLTRKYREDQEFFRSEHDFFETIFSAGNITREPSPRTPSAGIDQNQQISQGEAEKRPDERPSISILQQQSPKTSDEENATSELRSLTESIMCKICKSHVSVIVILPCGHLCMCEKCAENATKCPSCGTRIVETIKTFRS